MVNLHLQALSLLYMILVLVVFYSKSPIKSMETGIYKGLVWTNLYGIVLDIILVCFGYYSPYHFMAYFLNKCYMTYIAIWATLFSLYIFKTSLSKDAIMKYNDTINFFYIISTVIEICLIFLLDVQLYNKNGVMYSYGGSISVASFFAAAHVVAVVLVIVKNRQNLTLKKYIPILALVFLCILAFIFRLINPGLLLTTTIITFITILMYFTLENPDVKMLEEFKLAKDRAEKANQEKEIFLYDIVQDIRMPLNEIKKASAWLDNNSNEIVIKDIHDGTAYINSKATNILDKVNNVLDITNMELTNIKVYQTQYNIINIFDHLKKTYKDKNGVKIRFLIDSNVPNNLYGDALRIRQLISILIDNAFKYTDEGYIEVKLNSIIKRNACRLIVTVEDTGCGIKASEIDEIFNKENRLYNNLDKIDDNKKNLAIAKSIASLLGGVLLLDSEIGKGTRLTLVLDQTIYKDKSVELNKLEENTEKYITNKKVLLVIDDPEYMEKVSKKLSKYDITLETANMGAKCVERIRLKHSYDLIILDEQLKSLSSLEILHKLKKMTGFNTPVCLLTDNVENEKFIEEGFSYLVDKKVTKKSLDNLIESIQRSTY